MNTTVSGPSPAPSAEGSPRQSGRPITAARPALVPVGVSAALVALSLCLAACNKPRTTDPAPPPEDPPPSTEGAQSPGSAGASGQDRTDPDRTGGAGENPPSVEPPGAPVSLRVLAPPELAPALRSLAKTYATTRGGRVEIDVEPVPNKDLLGAMAGDVPPDVLVTFGYAPLAALRAAGLVAAGTTRRVGWLPLVVSLPADSKAKTLADLLDGQVTVGMADPTRRAGAVAARALLRRAGLAGKVREVVLPGDPGGPLRDGVIGAFIGWGRPQAADVGTLVLPTGQQSFLPLPAAATSVSEDPQAATAFVDWLHSQQAGPGWEAGGVSVRLDPRVAVMPTILPRGLPAPRRSAGGARVGERALLVGGEAGGELLDTLTFFDPSRVTCTDAKARLPSPRQGVAAAFLPGQRRVLLAGGATAAGTLSDLLRYDPDGDTLEVVEGGLPLPLSHSAVATTPEWVYLLGGKGNGANVLDAIVRIRVADWTAERLPAGLPAKRARSGAIVTGAAIWVVGGDSVTGPARTILALDPSTGTARYTAHKLPEGVVGPVVAPWDSGWLIAGGHRGTGLRDEIDTVDAEGRVARLPHRLPFPLGDATAIALADALYVFGGLTSDRVDSRILRFPY